MAVAARKPARQLVFVDGSSKDTLQQLADFLKINEEVSPVLENGDTEDAITRIVKASSALNSVPEKEFGPAYNLLVYAVITYSAKPENHLKTMCANLMKPITSSPANSKELSINTLQTIFNLLSADDPVRFNVLRQILRFTKMNNMFDTIKPALKNIPGWLKTWAVDEEDTRQMFTDIADAAADAGEDKISYDHLLLALQTFDPEDEEDGPSSDEARDLAIRTLKVALSSDKTWSYDFAALRHLEAVHALSDSAPVYAELLDIFAEQDLEDFNDFNEEHEGFLEKEKLDFKALQTKMRLLTLASMAAAQSDREIPYDTIAKGLQVPSEQVEIWLIDVIRAGLVEGRMSQSDKVFRVHKTTYRVFSEKQWRELQSRIDGWKSTMTQVLGVIQQAEVDARLSKEREQQELERKLAGAGLGDDRGYQRRNQGGYNNRQQHRERNDNDD